MSKLTQVDASRIMFAHAKAMDACKVFYARDTDAAYAAWRAAEVAFAELVAQLVEDENA
jgi:hypothetical protein